jgi:hypothetical protein
MHDLSKLFSGGRNKPAFEVVLARKGPFSGRKLRLATNEPRSAFEFLERNKEAVKA